MELLDCNKQFLREAEPVPTRRAEGCGLRVCFPSLAGFGVFSSHYLPLLCDPRLRGEPTHGSAIPFGRLGSGAAGCLPSSSSAGACALGNRPVPWAGWADEELSPPWPCLQERLGGSGSCMEQMDP